MGQISGKLVLLQISTDGGTTKKQLVCLKTSGFDLTNNVLTEETQCGVLKEVGNPNWGFDFDAIMETDPDSTKISYADMLALGVSGASFSVYQQSPSTGGGAGADFYISGSAILANIKHAHPAGGGLMAFSGRIEGSGIPDITA